MAAARSYEVSVETVDGPVTLKIPAERIGQGLQAVRPRHARPQRPSARRPTGNRDRGDADQTDAKQRALLEDWGRQGGAAKKAFWSIEALFWSIINLFPASRRFTRLGMRV